MLSMAQTILQPIHENPDVEIMCVMVLTPIFLNGLQIWIQDSFLKDNQDMSVNRLGRLMTKNGLTTMSLKELLNLGKNCDRSPSKSPSKQQETRVELVQNLIN